MHLNYLDFILLAPLVYGFIKGLSRGFVFEAASVIALLLGIWGAIHFSEFTADFISNRLGWKFQYMNIVAFIVTFIGIVFAVNMIARFVDKVINMIAMEFLNKLAGGVFGVLKIGIIMGIIMFLFETIDIKLNIIPEKIVQESLVYQAIETFTDKLFPMFDFDQLKNSGEDILKQT